MAARIFYQEDCNLSVLEGQKIAIIGYGSQGHAHALNLKESGCDVIIGLYEGSKSWAKAEAQGFEVYTAAEAAKKADRESGNYSSNSGRNKKTDNCCPAAGFGKSGNEAARTKQKQKPHLPSSQAAHASPAL